jgi:CRP/FNR family transcriptional regulator
LAQYLGTTVETISRTVQTLARAGLIEVVTSTRFIVTDLEGLIAASGNEDFDPATILDCAESAG